MDSGTHHAKGVQDVDMADATAIAEYIAQLSAELAKLGSGAGLKTLAYLLNLARLEAESYVLKASPPR